MKNVTSFLKNICVAGMIFIFSLPAHSQNVGIGISAPLEKLHVVGSIRSSALSGVGNRLVLSDANGTLVNATGLTSPAWLTTGNTGLNGGNTTTPGANFLGNTDAQNICFRTNNIERGRFSALGEFFVGTMNTVITGDLMNAVGTGTFPWAVNGYTSGNGGGVYGSVQAGTTVYGGVQGEYFGTNVSGAGVRGIGGAGTIGVSGQEVSGIGWAFASNGDYLAAPAWANYYITSDARLKKNIQPLTNGLQKVLQMKTYSYEASAEAYPMMKSPDGRKCLGFLAQELEQILPEAVAEKYMPVSDAGRQSASDKNDNMKFKAVSMDTVIPVLVEAIKEQQAQIDALKSRIAELEKK